MILNVFKLLLVGLAMAIVAWISVHILAFFGLFLAVTYILWWILFPKHRFCLMCLFKKKGEKCPFCRKDKIWVSLILDFFIILIFSGISVGIIYTEYVVLRHTGVVSTPKTVSFVIPSQGQYRVGEIIPLKIEITGIKRPINSVQADIGFDPNALAVVDISTQDSFANIFIQKEINNNGGWARLTGGLPNPGFSADHGVFGIVYFKSKTAGLTTVRFLSSSMVLANDGVGSNVLMDFPTTSYLIVPEEITPTEAENQIKLLSKSPPPVLGAESSQGLPQGTQLRFFGDTNPNVLGMESVATPQPQSSIFEKGLDWIGSLDSMVISAWQQVLHI